MPVTIYMQISSPPIDGNSTVKSHANQFTVLSLSYSAVAPRDVRPTFSPITVTVDAFNGPTLLDSLFKSTFHTVTFFTANSTTGTGTVSTFETITLTNATLTLFQETVTPGATAPVYELSFGYQRFELEQNAGGTTFDYNPGG